MEILKFLLSHWDDILVVGLLFISGVGGFIKWAKVQGPLFASMSSKEKIAYTTRLLENLIPTALVLITDAEIEFGGKTGKIKRSYVIDQLYKRIPDEYKKYITEDNMDAVLQAALEEAEKLWKTNPELLGSKGISQYEDPNKYIL